MHHNYRVSVRGAEKVGNEQQLLFNRVQVHTDIHSRLKRVSIEMENNCCYLNAECKLKNCNENEKPKEQNEKNARNTASNVEVNIRK